MARSLVAADDEAGVFADDLKKLVFFETRLYGDIKGSTRGQLGYTAFGNGIGNKNFWNVHRKETSSMIGARLPDKQKSKK
jgi:hypothetical protein